MMSKTYKISVYSAWAQLFWGLENFWNKYVPKCRMSIQLGRARSNSALFNTVKELFTDRQLTKKISDKEDLFETDFRERQK